MKQEWVSGTAFRASLKKITTARRTVSMERNVIGSNTLLMLKWGQEGRTKCQQKMSQQRHNFFLLCFALLSFADIVFFTIDGLWQPWVEQVYRYHFSNSISSLRVSMSHFGNTRNNSNLFIIITFMMVICDVTTAICQLPIWRSSKKCVLRWFRHRAIIKCTYTNLDGIPCYTPRLYRIAYGS